MTVQELILKNPKEVRKSPDLMGFYVEAFKSQFGYKPDCAGCTFRNDFLKLKKSIQSGVEPKKQKTMEQEKTFVLGEKRRKIYSYKKGGKTVRRYNHQLTEEFAVEYLTFGTPEEIAERKKKFRVLPKAILDKEKEKEEKKAQKEAKKIKKLVEEKEPKTEGEPKKKKANKKSK